MLSSCCNHEHAPEEWNIALIFQFYTRGDRILKITEAVSWENAIKKNQKRPELGLGRGSHVRILSSFFVTN
jgi:hypothetical protein